MGIFPNIFSIIFFALGYLWKQGGRYKSWKRRWFILNDNCLYYFEFTTDKEPRGIIPLENIMVSICYIHIHTLTMTMVLNLLITIFIYPSLTHFLHRFVNVSLLIRVDSIVSSFMQRVVRRLSKLVRQTQMER